MVAVARGIIQVLKAECPSAPDWMRRCFAKINLNPKVQEDLKISIKQPVLQGTVALESFWLLTSALGGAFGGSFYGYTESRENWDVFASQPFMAFAKIYNLPVQ